jgi:hypothetical protein
MLLSVTLMEVFTIVVRGWLLWELLYANNLVLMANSEYGLKDKLQRWNRAGGVRD